MAEVKDIIFEIGAEGLEEIQFEGGDFKIAESDQQHIQHILRASKGNYYQHPLVGLGIDTATGSPLNPQRVQQEIKLQLKADNIQPKTVEVSDDFIINIDAERIK